MSVPPSHPVSVLDAQPIRYVSREVLYLLWRWAETFQVELALERWLRLQGVGTFPLEWTAGLERERQLILDRLRWMRSREDPPPAQGNNVSTGESLHTVSPTWPGRGDRPFTPPENESNVRSQSYATPTAGSEVGEDGSPPEAVSPDQPHATMLNNAQNLTINGGTFYLVQGNLSIHRPCRDADTQQGHADGH